MKKNNDLRPEYDLSQLKSGIRSKYYRTATASTNLVLIEPELTTLFPDSESVNRATSREPSDIGYKQDAPRPGTEQRLKRRS